MVLDVRNSIRVFYLALIMKVMSMSNINCPINCRCESDFNKIDCSAANVDESTFKELTERTENLDLSRNEFTQLPEAVFLYCDNIIVLNVSFNKISTIHRYTFVGMDKLRILDLSYNRIRSVSDISNFIGSLNKLQILNLSANYLLNLGESENPALYSDSLQHLDASRCQIGHVHGTLVFRSLPKLEILNLSRNPLSRIEGFFSDSLRSLDVSESGLQFLSTNTFNNLRHLRELRIARNERLTSLYASYSKLSSPSLSYLDVSYCSIIHSNYASDLPEAHTVILRGNFIRAIPLNAFENNSKLENLDLSANRIAVVDEFAFNGADSLRYLDLSENFISILATNTFSFALQLIHLNLSSNSLQTLETIKAPSLRFLDVSFCRIKTVVANALLQTPFIQALNLSYNFVEKLPDNFSSKSLQILNAAFCHLTNISAINFYQLPALREIDLEGNSLVYTKNTTFANLNLRAINLSKNPWKCDCLDLNFHTFWKSLTEPIQLVDKSALRCQHPENLTGLAWEDACSSEWLHKTGRRKDVIVLLIIVTVLFVSGVVACVVAVRENWVTHRSRTSRLTNEFQHSGTVHGAGDDSENAEGGAVAESIRKLTQLPSYDEALLLPKLSFSDDSETPSRSSKIKKRQSGTQTDETMIAFLREVAENSSNPNNLEETYEDSRVREASKNDTSKDLEKNLSIRRRSWEEIEYINIAPLSVQCTEL